MATVLVVLVSWMASTRSTYAYPVTRSLVLGLASSFLASLGKYQVMTYPVEHLLHTKCVYEHSCDGFDHEINPGMIYTLFQLLDRYFVLV